MPNPIIQVSNLSKSYTISHEGKERYTALRDVMAQKVKKIFSLRGGTTKQPMRGGTTKQPMRGGTTKQPMRGGTTNVIARRYDEAINFEIEQGDRVGIIGRNGALR